MYDYREQFYQVMTRVKAAEAQRSRAASTQEPTQRENATVTEVMNGLIVTRPAKKVQDISENKNSQSEPEIIDLQEHAKSSKAASVPGINKLKEIHDFINRRY